jgi:protein CpxP
MKTFALITALLLTTALAHARGGNKQQELGLNDEQVKQMRTLKEKNHGVGKELQQKAKAAKDDLRQALGNPNASNEELQAKFDTAEQAKSAAHRQRFGHMLQVRAILTPDQRAKFQTLRKQWKDKNKASRRDQME